MSVRVCFNCFSVWEISSSRRLPISSRESNRLRRFCERLVSVSLTVRWYWSFSASDGARAAVFSLANLLVEFPDFPFQTELEVLRPTVELQHLVFEKLGVALVDLADTFANERVRPSTRSVGSELDSETTGRRAS